MSKFVDLDGLDDCFNSQIECPVQNGEKERHANRHGYDDNGKNGCLFFGGPNYLSHLGQGLLYVSYDFFDEFHTLEVLKNGSGPNVTAIYYMICKLSSLSMVDKFCLVTGLVWVSIFAPHFVASLYTVN